MRTQLLSLPSRLLLGLALLSVSALGQDTFSQVRVGTRPSGARFYVDGVPYSSTQSFLWARGSKHTVSIQSLQTATLIGQRMTFTGWESGGKTFSTLTETTITADPAIADITGVVTLEYLVKLQFTTCPDVTMACPASNGRVLVGGVAYYGEADLYLSPGGSLSLQAEPMPGFVFTRWSGVPIASERSPIQNLTIDRPTTLRAHFDGATPVQVLTAPEELQVYVDRALTKTPAQLDWAQGVQKLLSAPSPQRNDKGDLYIFDGWDGLPKGQNATFTPPVGRNTLLTMTARFVPGAPVSVYTEPPGLKVIVNGQDIFDRQYSFYAAVDSKVTLQAPVEQTDAAGRRFALDSWSNGTPDASGLLSLNVPVKGYTTTARYKLVPRLIVDSSPSGRMIQVDGKSCRTPCTVDKARGQSVPVSVPAMIPVTGEARYQWIGWEDSAATDRSFVMEADLRRVVGAYETAYRFSVTASPAGASSFAFDPPSEDNYYRAGETVRVTANARPGYRFRRWEGDLQGTYNAPTVQLAGPRQAMANFDVVPFADPTGVQNAAGKTPQPGVAPGSIGAIVGLNLAPSLQTGPASPLAQTLAGIVVRMGSRLMPLYWVSNERIEFQVPSDLEPGRYKLRVTRPGQEDAEVDMEVVSNNPGLYTTEELRPEGGAPLVKAFRPDGSGVTAANPALAGEEITLLATGCGAYNFRIPDGFALPTDMTFRLVDTVEVWLGDRPRPTTFAGGQGMPGLNSIRFKVPEGATGMTELKLRVLERESNLAVLPVR